MKHQMKLVNAGERSLDQIGGFAFELPCHGQDGGPACLPDGVPEPSDAPAAAAPAVQHHESRSSDFKISDFMIDSVRRKVLEHVSTGQRIVLAPLAPDKAYQLYTSEEGDTCLYDGTAPEFCLDLMKTVLGDGWVGPSDKAASLGVSPGSVLLEGMKPVQGGLCCVNWVGLSTLCLAIV
jgi:hypothetical protein